MNRAEVKNAWNYTSISQDVFMPWCSDKHVTILLSPLPYTLWSP